MSDQKLSSATLEHILAHRSIRQFKAQKLDRALIEQLVDAGRAASTSNHLQCVSIIRVTDEALRSALMHCCSNQEYVQKAPEFWVFCIDFHKHKQICPQAQLDYTEVLLIGAVDTGIMAQNLLLAAESLGLGGVYIGSLRNQMEKVGELLGLPAHCVPLVGLCLGYPDQDPPLKPRLPRESLFFENRYQPLDSELLADYDRQMADYYRRRSDIDMNWSKNVIKSLDKPVRPEVLGYLQKQGFAKK
ncbi:nitroreductase [Mesocricetibacter intestinalis]|uniref:Nitroreductase n=1 Tax=Mesocricetibacter intestinalis TaxID=1521930 RepID=A0A4R6VD29_9PAST|nr:oxygen-insensitive NADPH nitroreductase [Mesocricetibacter intestinalis]TDQ59776.1 nitroreductase [Mesocricetibacter intestinalis]